MIGAFEALTQGAEEVEVKPDGRAIEETLLVGLLEPTVAPRILEAARPGDFYYDLHRRFAEVAFAKVGAGAHLDRVVFRAAAGDDDKLLAFADQVFAKAEADPPPPGKVVTYLELFAEEALRRSTINFIDATRAALEKGELSREAAVDRIFKAIGDLDVARRLAGVGKTEGEELDAYFADLEARQSPAHDFLGLDTGFDHLNYVINGLSPGLVVLGAMPSTGKTTLAKQIADQVVAKHTDAACLFVSLEQSKEELRVKTLSRLSGVENRDLQRGRLNPQEAGWRRVVEAKEEFAQFAGRLQVLEGGRETTVERIRLAALQLRQKTQAARLLIVVDYLQILPTEERFGDLRQKTSFVTSELRRLGRDLDAAVLAISSVSRAAYDKEKGSLDVFKESGDVEFSADVALVMVRDPDKAKGSENYLGLMRGWKRIRCEVVKNRNGERARIEFDFFPEVSRFKEVSRGQLPD